MGRCNLKFYLNSDKREMDRRLGGRSWSRSRTNLFIFVNTIRMQIPNGKEFPSLQREDSEQITQSWWEYITNGNSWHYHCNRLIIANLVKEGGRR